MKNALFIFILFTVCIWDNSAQNPVRDQIAALPPKAVMYSFEQHYPTVKEFSWKLEKDKYAASFRLNDRNMSCLFDSSGLVLETETEISFNELPDAYKSGLDKARVLKVERSETVQGTIYYEVETIDGAIHYEVKEKPDSQSKTSQERSASGL
ncbi:MAG: hypothetical protein R3A50_14355 [Saprospiraceae bacterium]